MPLHTGTPQSPRLDVSSPDLSSPDLGSPDRARLGPVALLGLGLLAGFALACAPEPPQRLLLISVDTLRADRLGAYGGPSGLTPHLDALAAQSHVFEWAYAPAPFTLPSMSGLLTGVHPHALPVRSNSAVLPTGVPTLASRLRDAGWRTGAVVGSWVLRSRSGLDRGFEIYDQTLPGSERQRSIPERVARDTTAAALSVLDELTSRGTRRAFLWIHYQDPHGPYDAPAAFASDPGPPVGRVQDRTLPASPNQRGLGAIPLYQLAGDERDSAAYRAAYHAEIRYLDAEIGRLLEGLRSRGLLGRTAIAFVADHGESLGENNIWFAHGEALSEAQLRVPLLIRLPDGRGGRNEDPASLLDVVPTLAALVDLPLAGDLPGRNLLASPAVSSPPLVVSTFGEALRPAQGIISGRFKYVRTASDESLRLLGHDSMELTGREPRQLQALRQELKDGLARLKPERAARSQELSPEERAQLEALGYVDDGSEP